MDHRRRRLTRRLLGASTLAPAALWPLYGHLVVLTAAAGREARRRHRRVRGAPVPPRTRFTVLIPAHDEERLVGATVDSLLSTAYPPALVSVHVLADHCRDRTAEVARRAGAHVHHHEDPEPAGKAAALRWGLDRALPPRHGANDAVVVIDADSVVDPGFFEALDRRLGAGAAVVQARYGVRRGPESALVTLRAAALDLRHFVRPLGRTALGGSSGLYGNGMAFRPEVLRRRPWPDHLTEDLAAHTELLLAGTVVGFEPDAVVRAEMPSGRGQATSQNERWERGRIEAVRHGVPRLLRAAVAGHGVRRRALIDGALDLLVPPLSVLAVVAGAATAWSVTVHAVIPGAASRIGRGNALALGLALAVHVLGGLRIARAPGSAYAALVRAPALVAWKTGLWVRMLGTTDVAWVRTDRGEAA